MKEQSPDMGVIANVLSKHLRTADTVWSSISAVLAVLLLKSLRCYETFHKTPDLD